VEDNIVVSFEITNKGKVPGAEVAQLYVSDEECSLIRPLKELKGFEKVFLKPGETKTVSIRLDDSAFRFYDPYEHRFVIEPGRFTIRVGASSEDIRLTTSLTL
jgi:beta-glucosidase